MVSAITNRIPFVCVVGDQRTTSRRNGVLPVDTQLLSAGNVSLVIGLEFYASQTMKTLAYSVGIG